MLRCCLLDGAGQYNSLFCKGIASLSTRAMSAKHLGMGFSDGAAIDAMDKVCPHPCPNQSLAGWRRPQLKA